jgi:hypothetical protein
MLTLISAIEIIDFNVNEFHLMKRFLLGLFSPLNCPREYI